MKEERIINQYRFNLMLDKVKTIKKNTNILTHFSNNHIYFSSLGNEGIYNIDLEDVFYLAYKKNNKIYLFQITNIIWLIKVRYLNSKKQLIKEEELKKYLNIIKDNYAEIFSEIWKKDISQNKKLEELFKNFIFIEKFDKNKHTNLYDYIILNEETDFVVIFYPDFENIKRQLDKIKLIIDLKFNKIYNLPDDITVVKYLNDEDLKIGNSSSMKI